MDILFFRLQIMLFYLLLFVYKLRIIWIIRLFIPDSGFWTLKEGNRKICIIRSFFISDRRSKKNIVGGRPRHLDDFEVAKVAAVDGEADEGAHAVPALQTCGARVDMKQA